MKSVLITGGMGDLASYIESELKGKFIVDCPNKTELDVTSPKNVECFFIDKFYDIVINCAGTLYSSHILNSEPERWINDIKVNLIGTYLICREAIIKNKETLMINISSTAAYNSYADWTSYCAAKAGVIKISNGLFLDGYNIITFCPGAIDTKLRDGLNIANNNIMSIDEAGMPIVNAILNNSYCSGDVIFYRKNQVRIINEIDRK